MSPHRPTRVLLVLSLVGCATNSGIPGETDCSGTIGCGDGEENGP